MPYYFKYPLELIKFKDVQEKRLSSTKSNLIQIMLDINDFIIENVKKEQDIVQKKNKEKLRMMVTEEDRKLLQEMELSKEFIEETFRFQFLLNIRFEESARLCFINSILKYCSILSKPLEIFRQINDFDPTTVLTPENITFD